MHAAGLAPAPLRTDIHQSSIGNRAAGTVATKTRPRTAAPASSTSRRLGRPESAPSGKRPHTSTRDAAAPRSGAPRRARASGGSRSAGPKACCSGVAEQRRSARHPTRNGTASTPALATTGGGVGRPGGLRWADQASRSAAQLTSEAPAAARRSGTVTAEPVLRWRDATATYEQRRHDRASAEPSPTNATAAARSRWMSTRGLSYMTGKAAVAHEQAWLRAQAEGAAQAAADVLSPTYAARKEERDLRPRDGSGQKGGTQREGGRSPPLRARKTAPQLRLATMASFRGVRAMEAIAHGSTDFWERMANEQAARMASEQLEQDLADIERRKEERRAEASLKRFGHRSYASVKEWFREPPQLVQTPVPEKLLEDKLRRKGPASGTDDPETLDSTPRPSTAPATRKRPSTANRERYHVRREAFDGRYDRRLARKRSEAVDAAAVLSPLSDVPPRPKSALERARAGGWNPHAFGYRALNEHLANETAATEAARRAELEHRQRVKELQRESRPVRAAGPPSLVRGGEQQLDASLPRTVGLARPAPRKSRSRSPNGAVGQPKTRQRRGGKPGKKARRRHRHRPHNARRTTKADEGDTPQSGKKPGVNMTLGDWKLKVIDPAVHNTRDFKQFVADWELRRRVSPWQALQDDGSGRLRLNRGVARWAKGGDEVDDFASIVDGHLSVGASNADDLDDYSSSGSDGGPRSGLREAAKSRCSSCGESLVEVSTDDDVDEPFEEDEEPAALAERTLVARQADAASGADETQLGRGELRRVETHLHYALKRSNARNAADPKRRRASMVSSDSESGAKSTAGTLIDKGLVSFVGFRGEADLHRSLAGALAEAEAEALTDIVIQDTAIASGTMRDIVQQVDTKAHWLETLDLSGNFLDDNTGERCTYVWYERAYHRQSDNGFLRFVPLRTTVSRRDIGQVRRFEQKPALIDAERLQHQGLTRGGECRVAPIVVLRAGTSHFVRASAPAQILLKPFASARSLRSLDLSDNLTGVQGAAALAGALTSSVSELSEVSLKFNSINGVAAARIAAALHRNRALRTLALEGNLMRDAGAEAVAEALELNETLEHVGLEMCEIGWKGATVRRVRGHCSLRCSLRRFDARTGAGRGVAEEQDAQDAAVPRQPHHGAWSSRLPARGVRLQRHQPHARPGDVRVGARGDGGGRLPRHHHAHIRRGTPIRARHRPGPAAPCGTGPRAPRDEGALPHPEGRRWLLRRRAHRRLRRL